MSFYHLNLYFFAFENDSININADFCPYEKKSTFIIIFYDSRFGLCRQFMKFFPFRNLATELNNSIFCLFCQKLLEKVLNFIRKYILFLVFSGLCNVINNCCWGDQTKSISFMSGIETLIRFHSQITSEDVTKPGVPSIEQNYWKTCKLQISFLCLQMFMNSIISSIIFSGVLQLCIFF